MTARILKKILQDWARVGAGFAVEAAQRTPDLEQLLLDTARHLRAEPRLFSVPASWLCQYYELVAKHRLQTLAHELLTQTERSRLGFLLDTVATHTASDHFKGVIAACHPARPPHPLYQFQTLNPAFAKLAEKYASPLSRRWGLWSSPFAPKQDVIRPPAWVFKHNPSLRQREVFGGDLRATIIATLDANPGAGQSELRLVKTCGASRDALRRSLDRLERYGHVERVRRGRAYAVQVT